MCEWKANRSSSADDGGQSEAVAKSSFCLETTAAGESLGQAKVLGDDSFQRQFNQLASSIENTQGPSSSPSSSSSRSSSEEFGAMIALRGQVIGFFSA